MASRNEVIFLPFWRGYVNFYSCFLDLSISLWLRPARARALLFRDSGGRPERESQKLRSGVRKVSAIMLLSWFEGSIAGGGSFASMRDV